MPPPREVVVCVDESGHSENAWSWTADTLLPCLPPRARVRLLCIAVPAADDGMSVGEDAPWTMAADDEARRAEQRSAMAAAQDTVRGLLARHPPPPDVHVVELVVPMAGSVNETLEAILREAPADIAVVGSRGMGTLRRCARGCARQRGGARLCDGWRR